MKWQIFHRTLEGQYIHLNDGHSFIVDKNRIVFDSGNQIDILKTEDNWPEEKMRLVRAIRRAKFRASATTCAKWLLVAGVSVAVAMMFNGTLMQANSRHAVGLESMQPLPLEEDEFTPPDVSSLPSPRSSTSPDQTSPDIDNAEEQARNISKALSTGASIGGNTIKLGPDSSDQTLYVFSDPLCPHCQELEPELHELAARGIHIEIFPVSVIGGDKSVSAINAAMCRQDNEERLKVWEAEVLGTADPLSQSETCEAGQEALARNNQFFDVANLRGTPTLFNANGQQPPDTGPLTADTIERWLKQ